MLSTIYGLYIFYQISFLLSTLPIFHLQRPHSVLICIYFHKIKSANHQIIPKAYKYLSFQGGYFKVHFPGGCFFTSIKGESDRPTCKLNMGEASSKYTWDVRTWIFVTRHILEHSLYINDSRTRREGWPSALLGKYDAQISISSLGPNVFGMLSSRK